jgi:hypothetical protein
MSGKKGFNAIVDGWQLLIFCCNHYSSNREVIQNVKSGTGHSLACFPDCKQEDIPKAGKVE